MSRRIAAFDAGTSYHHESLYGERLRDAFDRFVYVRHLPDADLSDVDVLIVTCRMEPAALAPADARLRDFLADGGIRVAMGFTGPHPWLPRVDWSDTATDFWWWKEGGELGPEAAAPDDPFFGYAPPKTRCGITTAPFACVTAPVPPSTPGVSERSACGSFVLMPIRPVCLIRI